MFQCSIKCIFLTKVWFVLLSIQVLNITFLLYFSNQQHIFGVILVSDRLLTSLRLKLGMSDAKHHSPYTYLCHVQAKLYFLIL